MRIALDVDGVLADVLEMWAGRRGIPKGDARSWYFWKDLGIPADEFYRGLDACWQEWRLIPPTEDRIGEKAAALAELGTVDIVTARTPATDAAVREWLEHHGVPYSKYVSVPSGAQKAELEYDVFIDDSPINAEKITEAGMRVIVYEQPWNAGLDPARYRRVAGLEEAASLLG
ncbi:MAG: hypothetical protein MPJ07_01130 [Nitrosopumilus sp.]|nr:hypothetical protein [Nitrosopumilus sp.]